MSQSWGDVPQHPTGAVRHSHPTLITWPKQYLCNAPGPFPEPANEKSTTIAMTYAGSSSRPIPLAGKDSPPPPLVVQTEGVTCEIVGVLVASVSLMSLLEQVPTCQKLVPPSP
jgi:hypothetical protein